jgi:hypothetical protein
MYAAGPPTASDGSSAEEHTGVWDGALEVTAVVQTGFVPVESVVKVMEATCGFTEPPHPLSADRTRRKAERIRLRDDRRFRGAPKQNPVIKVAPGKVIQKKQQITY